MGDELKRLRKAVGLTQHELGKRAGVEPWRVTKAELGMIELAPEEVSKLKAAIGRAARQNAQRVEEALGQPAAV